MKSVVGMSFDSIKSVEEFYKLYAHKGGTDEVVSKKFLCSRQGFKKINVPPTEKQKNHTETRCGCDAHVSVKLGMVKGITLLQ
jgi:hypothetical protein